MSRSIAESLSLLSETLGNCKTNLKEKEVTDVDNIKISDVDEKIAEIKSGGGGSSNEIDLSGTKYQKCIIVFISDINSSDYNEADVYFDYYNKPNKYYSTALEDQDIYRYIGIAVCKPYTEKTSVFMIGTDSDGGEVETDWVEVDISTPKLILIENNSLNYK